MSILGHMIRQSYTIRVHRKPSRTKMMDHIQFDCPDFFEWWYFDVHTDDGCTAVVGFRNRDYSKMHLPPIPQVTLLVVIPGVDN